jgi:hypothetical protein
MYTHDAFALSSVIFYSLQRLTSQSSQNMLHPVDYQGQVFEHNTLVLSILLNRNMCYILPKTI